MTRSPGCAQRKQCRHGNLFGESAMTTPWSGAPATAARRAASATLVASGTIWKFKVFMSTAKCIASIRASTKFGQRILISVAAVYDRRLFRPTLTERLYRSLHEFATSPPGLFLIFVQLCLDRGFDLFVQGAVVLEHFFCRIAP